jgi:hypothetical protein
MLTRRSPHASTLGLIDGGRVVHVTYPLRAWTLAEGAMREPIDFWSGGLERNEGCVSLFIPIHPMNSPDWKRTRLGLAMLREVVSAFRGVRLGELAGEEGHQLFWIDALTVRAGIADISVLASPELAVYIKSAPPEVFHRTTERMVAAECVLTGQNGVPRTRGASRYHGALHLSVGEDCACLGVPANVLPRDEQTGWPAYGHNLRLQYRVLLVLVALAALEDEFRTKH